MATPVRESVVCRGSQEFEFVIKLTEAEARVLEALFTYGHEALMKQYFELGKHYMTKIHGWEDATKSLGEKARSAIPPQLARADAARAAFTFVQQPIPPPSAP